LAGRADTEGSQANGQLHVGLSGGGTVLSLPF
jgi:hypothetical protein